MPKTEQTIGKQIDSLYELRQQRLETTKKVDELKRSEDAMVAEIMTYLQTNDSSCMKGNLATFSISETTVPKVVDYNRLKEYIIATGYVHLLGRTVSAPAAREIWDLDEQIPGVEPLTLNKHSLTRSAK